MTGLLDTKAAIPTAKLPIIRPPFLSSKTLSYREGGTAIRQQDLSSQVSRDGPGSLSSFRRGEV